MAFARTSKLIRYNWPLYVVCLLTAACGLMMFEASWLPWAVRVLGAIAACTASWFAIASCCAFYWMFDRPGFLEGKWLSKCVETPPRTCVQISVCVEETLVPMSQVFPNARCITIDLFDREVMTEPAIARAKDATTQQAAMRARPDSIPLDDSSTEFTLVTLAAHEIRSATIRHKFFEELKRVTAREGCVVLVEHLRNLSAVLAFGPGCFHFYARAEWLAIAEQAGFRVGPEFDLNPFIHVFVLQPQHASGVTALGEDGHGYALTANFDQAVPLG